MILEKYKALNLDKIAVAPLVGAWIEIKFVDQPQSAEVMVAPLVGAWIEILFFLDQLSGIGVAPLVGAWIEIRNIRKKLDR